MPATIHPFRPPARYSVTGVVGWAFQPAGSGDFPVASSYSFQPPNLIFAPFARHRFPCRRKNRPLNWPRNPPNPSKTVYLCSSPWGEETGEGGRKTNFASGFRLGVSLEACPATAGLVVGLSRRRPARSGMDAWSFAVPGVPSRSSRETRSPAPGARLCPAT
jgi:hypothetical protein